eukprot:maker-scaffold161_size295871-snap-gene-1.34 protein:Tk05113 transcript:maker-scaffold161_size295871-snap-gene-1.34-mRNA-1 annotation:"hypothetical protein GUITHDRAFT_82324"
MKLDTKDFDLLDWSDRSTTNRNDEGGKVLGFDPPADPVLSFAAEDTCASPDADCSERHESRTISTHDTYEFLKARTKDIKAHCGEVCQTEVFNTNVVGKGQWYDIIEKNINCQELFENVHITDFELDLPRAMKKIPKFLLDDYSYQGRVPLLPMYMDDSHGITHSLVWSEEEIRSFRSHIRNGNKIGSYGEEATQRIMQNIKDHLSVQDKHVLVIGSQHPWIEAILLEFGAKEVTTLEYVKIVSEVPQIKVMTPTEMAKAYLDGELAQFDAVVSFSSIEHSGLGRYGDGLNPFADLITMARTWCVTKEGGRALIGVPTGPDQVLFNAAKVYGPLQYSHLFANWKQIQSEVDDSMYRDQCKYCYQPIHIIEK